MQPWMLRHHFKENKVKSRLGWEWESTYFFREKWNDLHAATLITIGNPLLAVCNCGLESLQLMKKIRIEAGDRGSEIHATRSAHNPILFNRTPIATSLTPDKPDSRSSANADLFVDLWHTEFRSTMIKLWVSANSKVSHSISAFRGKLSIRKRHWENHKFTPSLVVGRWGDLEYPLIGIPEKRMSRVGTGL